MNTHFIAIRFQYSCLNICSLFSFLKACEITNSLSVFEPTDRFSSKKRYECYSRKNWYHPLKQHNIWQLTTSLDWSDLKHTCLYIHSINRSWSKINNKSSTFLHSNIVLHAGQYTNTDNGIKNKKKTQTRSFYSIYVKFTEYP